MASKQSGQGSGDGVDASKRRQNRGNTNHEAAVTANRAAPAAGPQLSSNEVARATSPALRSASSALPSSNNSQDPSRSRSQQRTGISPNIPDQPRAAARTADAVRQASSPSRIPTSAAAATAATAAPISNVQAGDVPSEQQQQPHSTNESHNASNAGPKRSSPLSESTKGSASSTTQDPASGSDSNRPRWPVPQRLKSPPPSYVRQPSNTASKRSSSEPDQSEQTQNALATPRGSQDSQVHGQDQIPNANTGTAKSPTSPNPQSATAPSKFARGFSGVPTTLETVDEGDQSTPPGNNLAAQSAPLGSQASVQASTSEPPTITYEQDREKELPSMPEATSDPERLNPSANRPRVQSVGPAPPARKHSTHPSSPDGKQNTDGPSNRMIAETETVASIPQTALSTAAANDRTNSSKKEDSGTVKAKSTSESLRPKRDRKKVSRKPASIISGTGSTKADLFEAKVSSAVDEDSSDSDETFVYESNPPELKHRQMRHHSRTPSVTSVQSLGDRRVGLRGIDGVLNNHVGVRGKRSMKFARSSYASSGVESESEMPSIKKHHNHHKNHHHHGRQHQQADATTPVSKPSKQTTEDSPFSQAARMRNNVDKPSSRTPSQTRTYGSINGSHSPPMKKAEYLSPCHSSAEHVNEEQVPLMGSVRTHRNHTRRQHNHDFHHLRHSDVDYEGGGVGQAQVKRRWPANFCGCIFMTVILLLILGGVGLVVGTTKPLVGVKVLEIQNLLASEQEIMLDLLVEAVNPNLVSISVSNMDVNIFAKSAHVKSIHEETIIASLPEPEPVGFRTRHRSLHGRKQEAVSPPALSGHHAHEGPPEFFEGIDEGNDPIFDEPPPELDPATMLLGRILEFDSSLTFEPSPFAQEASNSTGELRLPKPGNVSETGGSKRWERVLKYDFELIVRGILKYQLPLSSRFLTAPVQGRIQVHPQNTSLLLAATGQSS